MQQATEQLSADARAVIAPTAEHRLLNADTSGWWERLVAIVEQGSHAELLGQDSVCGDLAAAARAGTGAWG